jgi:hypothetical protein
MSVAHGGLVVACFATVPKIRGFKPVRGQWIFKDDKVRSTASFGEEIMPSVPRRKIYGMIKNKASMKEIHVGKIH